MAKTISTFGSVGMVKALNLWINRGLEALWLLMAFGVPLAYLGQDYAFSEAKIAYVEVPKVALLRTLAALMALLWLIEWAIQTRPASNPTNLNFTTKFSPRTWVADLRGWIQGRPNPWLVLAVWFFLATTLLTTVLSGSFKVSLWGEVPGQDGYATYTVIAYIVAFGVITTHLKSRAQLWRLFGVIVAMGVVVGGYAILQHYGHDVLGLTEETGGGIFRATAFMGNAIFTAAVLSMTIPLSLGVSVLALGGPTANFGQPGLKLRDGLKVVALLTLCSLILAIQLLGISFTLSRGPWMGTLVSLAVFFVLVSYFVGWRVFSRATAVAGFGAALTLAFLQQQGSIAILGSSQWFGLLIAVVAGLGAVILLVNWRNLGKPLFVLGLVILLAASIMLAPGKLGGSLRNLSGETGQTVLATTGSDFQGIERFSSIQSGVLEGFAGGRATHWKVSWQLIKERPWFEFDSLSFSWLRPLIGYGPDLFRYTYLLRSPAEGINILPLEPDHAHNYFINQAVEQGILGLFSSLGIFSAVFLAGGYILFRQRSRRDSHLSQLLLITLVAILAGRFIEMMVGVARVSDLTILWIMLAAIAALPMGSSSRDAERGSTASTQAQNTLRRRANRRSSPSSPANVYDWRLLWRLAIVAWLICGIGVLTWVKSVNYVRAAVVAGEAVGHFQDGEFQTALTNLDRSIELAPDVSPYYNYRSQIYSAFLVYTAATPERECSLQPDIPYHVCLALKGLDSNLSGAAERPFYYRSHWQLANSAFNLTLSDQAVRFFRESVELVPSSWPLINQLAEAYIEAEQPSAALSRLSDSLAITKDSPISAGAYFLQGIAYRNLNKIEDSIRSLEDGLAIGLTGPNAGEAHQMLTALYASLGATRTFEAYDKAIQRNPKDVGAYYNRGAAYLDNGQYDRAQSDFDNAIGLDAAHSLSYLGRGKVKVIEGHASSAIEDFKQAIKYKPEFLEAHTNLGQAYLQLGRTSGCSSIGQQQGKCSPDDQGVWYQKAIGNFDMAVELDSVNAISYVNRGLAFITIGQFIRAIQDIDLALELDPQLTEGYVARGSAYGELGQHQRAIEDTDRAIEIDPKSADAYLVRADRYNDLGQYQRAIDDSNQVIKLDPNTARAYAILGAAYLNLGQSLPTIQNLDQSIVLDPSDADAYYNRGRAYFSLGIYSLATVNFDNAIALMDGHTLAYIGKGNVQLKNGNTAGAIKNFETAIALQPDFAEAHTDLGLAFLGMVRTISCPDAPIRNGPCPPADQKLLYGKAMGSFDRAMRIDPNLVSTLNARGSAYLLFGEYQQALSEFENAIRLQPLQSDGYRNRAKAYFELGRHERAISDYDEAILLNPQDGQSYNGRGAIFTLLGQTENAAQDYYQAYTILGIKGTELGNSLRAVQYLDAALADNPQNAQSLVFRGRIHSDLGQHAQALEDFDRAVHLNYEDAEIYAGRAAANLGLGRIEQTIEDLDEAISLDPQPAEYYVQRGLVFVELGQFQSAIEDFNQAIQRSTFDHQTYQQRGLAYNETGEYELAIQDYDQAIRLGSQDPVAHSGRGDAFQHLGQLDLAIQSYDEAILLDLQNISAYKARGRAYAQLGKSRRAVDDYYLGHLLEGRLHSDSGDLKQTIQSLTEAIRLGLPDSEAFTSRGLAFIELGEFQKAIEDLDQAILLNPQDSQAYDSRSLANTQLGHFLTSRGLAFIQLDEFQRAIKDLDKAILLNPQDHQAYDSRGLAYIELGQYDRAIQNLDRAIEMGLGSESQGVQHVLPYYHRGLAYFNQDRFEQANLDLEAATRWAPNLVPALALGAEVASELGNLQQVIDYSTRALNLNPGYVELYISRALAYDKLGSTKLAFEDMDQAIRLGLNDAAAYAYRGRYYSKHLDHQQLAIWDLDEAIRLGSRATEIYAYKGVAFSKLGEAERSIKNLDQAILLESRDPELYAHRASMYSRLGESALALQDLDQAVRLSPKDWMIYALIGQTYNQLLKYEQAISALEEAIRLDDGIATGEHRDLSARTYFDLGIARFNLKQYQRAMGNLDSARQWDSQYLGVFIESHLELGNYGRAIEVLNHTITSTPDNHEAYILRGRIYLERGQSNLAARDFERADRLKNR